MQCRVYQGIVMQQRYHDNGIIIYYVIVYVNYAEKIELFSRKYHPLRTHQYIHCMQPEVIFFCI